jgi:hypothetical protein
LFDESGSQRDTKYKENKMKKVMLSVFGLSVLAACSGYDYYKTDLRYRQDGKDCVYYYNEKGEKFNEEIRSLKDAKKIVYRNVRCEDLYNDDTFNYERNDRKAIVPVYVDEKPVTTKCGCDRCAKKRTLKNRYIIVPAYAG